MDVVVVKTLRQSRGLAGLEIHHNKDVVDHNLAMVSVGFYITTLLPLTVSDSALGD